MAVVKKTAEEIGKMTDAELNAYEAELAAERKAAEKAAEDAKNAGGEGDGEGEGEDDDPDGAPGSAKRKSMYERFKKEEKRRKDAEAALEAERQARAEDTRKLVEAVVSKDDKGGAKDEDPEPTAPAAFDVRTARRKYHELMREGEFDKATEWLDKIDDHAAEVERYRANRDAWKDRQTEKRIAAEVDKGTKAALSTAAQQRLREELADVCEEIYEEFPFLNHEAEDRDEDAINAVFARRNVLIAEGMSPIRALRKAAAEKGPRFAKLQPGYEEGDGDGKDDKGKGGKKDEEPKGESRQDRIRRLTEEAAGKTPPNPAKGSKGARDVSKKRARDLTDDELRNMTDEQLAEYDGRKRFAKEHAD